MSRIKVTTLQKTLREAAATPTPAKRGAVISATDVIAKVRMNADQTERAIKNLRDAKVEEITDRLTTAFVGKSVNVITNRQHPTVRTGNILAVEAFWDTIGDADPMLMVELTCQDDDGVRFTKTITYHTRVYKDAVYGG